MTEQQIKDGYGRLGEALAPPQDTLERVDRRLRERRRRRRTALAGGGVLGILATGGVVVAALSGDEGTNQPPVAVDPGPAPRSSLVLTRSDGTTVAFPDVTVSCDPPVTEAGDPISEETGRIWLYSPIRTSGSEKGDDVVLHEPFVYFEGDATKIARRTYTFPNDWNMATAKMPMILFAADPDQQVDGRANEASSQEMDTKGTVQVLEASCDPAPVLRIQVDMTLGSELEGPPVDVRGAAH
jgi:hypothetical protein